MNIFVLNHAPYRAAREHCDKHVPKMIVESAQMLCTAHRLINPDEAWHDRDKLYKVAYPNHPCTRWARESAGNYRWLYSLFVSLLSEYTLRFDGKSHASSRLAAPLAVRPHGLLGNKTPHVLAMPERYKMRCPVQSYRQYYVGDKYRFARWDRALHTPYWWPSHLRTPISEKDRSA